MVARRECISEGKMQRCHVVRWLWLNSSKRFRRFRARAPDRRFPRWTNRPSFHQGLDALQRQHQAKREADFEQVLLAIRCFEGGQAIVGDVMYGGRGSAEKKEPSS
jgi:hypothetical protein